MISSILKYVFILITPFIEAFQFMSYLFQRSCEDLPTTYSGLFYRVLYVLYELSVVGFCIMLRWLIMSVYHTIVGFFSLFDLVCKSFNRQMRNFARRNYEARVVSVDSSQARRRKRGKNHKRQRYVIPDNRWANFVPA